MSTMRGVGPLVLLCIGRPGHWEPGRLLWDGGARWLRVHGECGHHGPLLPSRRRGCPHQVLWNYLLYPLDCLWGENRHLVVDLVFHEPIQSVSDNPRSPTYCWPPPDSVLEHGDIKVSHYIKRESIRTSLEQYGSHFISTYYKVNTCPFAVHLSALVMYRPFVETTAPLYWRIYN